jgi:hypothetical protein
MALLINVTMLVDADLDAARSKLAVALANLDSVTEGDDQGWLVDWHVQDAQPIHKSLKDSIVNGTYAKGDFVRPWLIFSQTHYDNNARFWPHAGGFYASLGWSASSQAQNFGATSSADEHLAKAQRFAPDAVLVLAPTDPKR